MSDKRFIVVGGGPAGLMAAGRAAEGGADVLLLEKMKLTALKLGITGKGRCNITNNCTVQEFLANIPDNPRFLYSAVSSFPPSALMEFFEGLGVPLKTERGSRVFPVSDRALDVVHALRGYALANAVRISHGRAAHVVTEGGRAAFVEADGRRYPAEAVLLATGGLSYPATGSTGDGYAVAAELGHTIVTPRPSLVALKAAESFCGECAGLTLKNISVTLYDGDKELYSDFGELLFTHTGVSGPTVLSASAHMRRPSDGYSLAIDLKPALDAQTLDARILRDFAERKNRSLGNALDGLLPAALRPVVAEAAGIPPQTEVNSVTREQRRALVGALKGLRLTSLAPESIDGAIVTAGGVDVSEVNPKTMESKLVPGLYFAGELLNVDGYTGGFNLHTAFATGAAAAKAVINTL